MVYLDHLGMCWEEEKSCSSFPFFCFPSVPGSRGNSVLRRAKLMLGQIFLIQSYMFRFSQPPLSPSWVRPISALLELPARKGDRHEDTYVTTHRFFHASLMLENMDWVDRPHFHEFFHKTIARGLSLTHYFSLNLLSVSLFHLASS